MANVLEVANLAWLQLNPKGSDESSITLEEYITTAQSEAAHQLWLASKLEKRENGYYDIPSYLLTEKEFEVKNNEIDLCGETVATWLSDDRWLVQIGELGDCDCEYVQTTSNLAKLLCDEDSRGHGNRQFYVKGKKIKFPQGAHKKNLLITYANMGENLDGEIEISDEIAALVRRALIEVYGGKTNPEDTTNNSTPNT